jgi:DNA-directed RNA polymerase sigma subunit (sigma70/sigma32)
MRPNWYPIKELLKDKNLTPRERAVIEARDRGETLEKIGQELGVTRERVRQIEGKAVYRAATRRP